MSISASDILVLRQAIELAQFAIGLSDPNPRVGCVLQSTSGQVASQGFTQQAGSAHAEVNALHAAATGGSDVRGGTAFVSLEPCAHHGRTPPCCDALIAAGMSRVVVATTDPFPQVAGQGIARLRAAGVTVDIADGAIARAARELNIGFFSRVLRKRPWVRMKVAASLDGRTALPNGVSQWITGPEARADGHYWRKRAGAVLTGIGTVQADDPRLDVRVVDTVLQPLRVVVDSRWQLSLRARLLQPPGQVLVVGAIDDELKMAALNAAGVETLLLPGPNGQVDLGALMNVLGERGINELHVEAGGTLNAAMLAGGHVDEVLAYVAPKLLGPGRDIATLTPATSLLQSIDLQFLSHELIGSDLRLLARIPGRDAFLA